MKFCRFKNLLNYLIKTNVRLVTTRNILGKLYCCIYKLTYKINDKLTYKTNAATKSFLIWDTRCSSIAFDFIFVVFDAFLFFSKRGYSTFDLIIYRPKEYLIKPSDWKSYSKYLTSNDLIRRIDSMIIPIAKSFKCIKEIHIVSTKKEYDIINNKKKFIFPEYYHPYYFIHPGLDYKRVFSILLSKERNPFPTIKAFSNRKTILEKISSSKDIGSYITLTLRDYGYAPERNTTSKDVMIAYDFANLIGAKLVIIPDNKNKLMNYSIPSSAVISTAARENIYYRISLYRYSEVNLFVPAGPAALSLFINQTKTIILKYGLSNSFDASAKFYQKEYKIKVNDQPYMAFNGYVIWYEENKYGANQVEVAYKKLNH